MLRKLPRSTKAYCKQGIFNRGLQRYLLRSFLAEHPPENKNVILQKWNEYSHERLTSTKEVQGSHTLVCLLLFEKPNNDTEFMINKSLSLDAVNLFTA